MTQTMRRVYRPHGVMNFMDNLYILDGGLATEIERRGINITVNTHTHTRYFNFKTF